MSKINTIRREGGSRVLSVTKILPPDWIIVEMKVTKKIANTIFVKIERVR